MPEGERNSPQQIARTLLNAALQNLSAEHPKYPPLGNVAECIDFAESVGRDLDPQFVFEYDARLSEQFVAANPRRVLTAAD